MRQDFFRRRTARQTPSREPDPAGGSTESRCRPPPSRGCSFAGHQPQPSANVNHEYTRMNTNVVCSDSRRSTTDDADATDWSAHVLPRVEGVVLDALAKKCSFRRWIARTANH